MAGSSTNTVRDGMPSRTALQVAALRAVHPLLDEPLVLADPIALPLLGAQREAALRHDPFVLNDPLSRGLRAAVIARCRFAEDALMQGLQQGVRQYVVLGAGLDTFGCRSRDLDPDLRVFELDHAGTQRWKRQLLADAGIDVPPHLTFVPMDFERDDLIDTLGRSGFRTDLPACIAWMGVTPYLSTDAIWRMLGAMTRLAAGSAVCFDFRVPAEQLSPIERVVDEVLGASAAAAGEPWLTAFDPVALGHALRAAGFTAADCVKPEDLNARYFARRRDGLCVGGGLRIMQARVGAAS